MAEWEIRYAQSVDGLDIAYQVIGDGPVDLVFVSGFITHLDWLWELPHFAWLEQLDGIARVITFDKRGTGLSDRSLGFGSLEERSQDIAAVMDAAGSKKAFLCGVSEGGPMSVLFAASNSDRVVGLVLYGTSPRFGRAVDWPFGASPELQESFLEFIETHWGTGRVFSCGCRHSVSATGAPRFRASTRFDRCRIRTAISESMDRLVRTRGASSRCQLLRESPASACVPLSSGSPQTAGAIPIPASC